jgi:hypothetical protein
MEMQQIIEMLAKMDAKLDTSQAMLAKMNAEMIADREERMVEMRAWRREMKAGQETTVAPLKCNEPISEDVASEAGHQKVPNGDAAGETGSGPNKRHKGRHLAAERRQKPKEKTRGNCGSRKQLTAAGRKMTRRAGVERRKGHGRKGLNKHDVAPRTTKGRTFGRKRLESSNRRKKKPSHKKTSRAETSEKKER